MPGLSRTIGWGIVSLMLVTSGESADPPASPAKANQLARESSPYLLQHAHNPVEWYPWGREAFLKAATEGKLVFLSSGYFACHWCHVMERESFQNSEIAALLNQHFVCIKLDREERPDVDHVYLTALQEMGQNGGWPLSMFLTSDGRPIAGGTYWPAEDREIDGERVPGFRSILQAVIEAHSKQPETLAQTAEFRARQTRRALLLKSGIAKPPELADTLVAGCVKEILAQFDPQYGGFGRPPEFRGPKFPQPTYLRLLQATRSLPEFPQNNVVLERTLTSMLRGGIYDQVGGGFHRYSTERTWTVPHFEKMLYDNAQLLELLAAEHRHRPQSEYARVLRETAEFVARELTAPDGAFYTAIDADSAGVEGEFYTWTAAQLTAALSNDAERTFVQSSVGMTGALNFEDQAWIPTRPGALSDADEARLGGLLVRLRDARFQRPRPAIDTKILTSWNGLMIAGLAAAGQALNDQALVERSARAAEFLLAHLQTEEGRLFHVYAAAPGEPPQARIPGFLEDYAYLVHGLLTLHDVTSDERWLTAAKQLTAVSQEEFLDRDHGGFFFTSARHEVLFVRMKDQHDGVLPSANSQMALNLLRLADKTGDDSYRELARGTMKVLANGLVEQPSSLTLLATALHRDLAGGRPQ